MTLFEPGDLPATGTDLVAVDPSRCPACGRIINVFSVDQPALVRHGGYGACRRTTVRLGWDSWGHGYET